MRICHVARAEAWAAGQRQGLYTADLERRGFIQAVYRERWPLTKRRDFAGVYAPLVLVEIESDLLTSVLIEEQPYPGAEEITPRIYGPLNLDAVVRVRDISRDRPDPAPVG